MAPVITAHPMTRTRADSQPKLIISQGEEQPTTIELQTEYTHLGRNDDNELPIPEPSISSRHCVFILSGSDVIVRDLNSSNGTYVNGEPITETILQPGDNIQVGVIDIKFVPGVRRPKLNTTSMTPVTPRAAGAIPPGAETTLKLPSNYVRKPNTPIIDDSKNKAFVSGSSAISYEQLATDVPQPKRSWGLAAALIVLILVIAGATAAYFIFLKP
jgi:pSer/pThr/pTyr-binding forkhead associated (FHA) protein